MNKKYFHWGIIQSYLMNIFGASEYRTREVYPIWILNHFMTIRKFNKENEKLTESIKVHKNINELNFK